MTKLRSLTNRLFPAKSRRRYYYEIGSAGMRVLAHEGFRSFLRKSKLRVRFKSEADKVALLWGENAREKANEKTPLLSWDAHACTSAYINRRISGNAGERWLQFTKRTFCPKMLKHGLSLGSGWGGLERDALGLQVCEQMDAYDISPGAIAVAKAEAEKQGLHHRVRYHRADLNQLSLETNKYDICFAAAILHHIDNLEGLVEQIHASLRDDGLFVIVEYVGPARFQWTDKAESLMNRMLAALPQDLKTSLRDRKTVKGAVKRPLVGSVVALDPSEAVRPEDILREVQRKFEVIYRADFGGTLLCFALADIIGNFSADDSKDRAILDLMTLLEETLIDEGVLTSDFVFVVARRHDRK